VAGTGTDAAPYFRIFNPVLQAKKFDPGGTYVRRWIPELARVPASVVHEPWRDTPLPAGRSGRAIGRGYPMPIVELGVARAMALAAYERARGRK
jgi:deoxyribodipyrimidine photo-lyase